MKLRKLKTFGFKTFAEPTTFDFADGITAIVGPNGSGKSNLVDAIRWVLGETSTKSLRSGKLEDVIFAGNEKRKPLGLAEVAITFDNSRHILPIDFSEVEITRRAYRAGESEYFINRSQVRLRDIHDLLMGTGLGPGSYSIVSQGHIDSILTSKPADRRALFEETAGINKFLARKNESMRRLEQTEQNAIRVNDLIAELERRIPELETQVRRSKRYRKVSTRVRDLEILSYMRASASRREEREHLRTESEKNEELRGAAAAKSATLSANLAELRTRIYQQELQLEELRSQGQERRAELARAESDYAAALAEQRAERRVQAENLRAEAERIENEAQAVSTRAEQLETAAGITAQKYAERERILAAQETQAAQARAQLEESERAVARAHEALARATEEYRNFSGEVKAAESRLHTIEELEASLEGHVPGTRAVVEAWQRGELGGIEGVVSNLIETDERYARAMDIAFGARLSNIVTRTSEDAERGIEFLNANERGRATFLPLDTLAQRDGKTLTSELQNTPGVIGYAHTLVRTKASYEGVVRFLVGNVLIVDTLQTGIALVRGRGFRDTIVTLSGEQITGGGAITGGRFKRETSILSRRVQAQTLREQLPGLRARLTELEAALVASAGASEGAIAGRDEAREALASLDVQLTETRAEMAALQADTERVKTEFATERARVDDLIAHAAAARDRGLSFENEPEESFAPMEHLRKLQAHIEGLQRGVAEIDGHIDVARREREQLVDRGTQTESDIQLAQNAERELAAGGEHFRTRLAEIEAELGMLVSQFAQNPATDEECRDVEERYKEEPDTVADDLPRLREELARLQANVNLNAEAERDEVAERERFLREQMDDLARARETLLASIKEIEQQTQVQFNETFEKVARAFHETYEALFPGGVAKMWQTDPENLSETGIEISVQPPGKKLMGLAALSGGERAMVAAALIFALIKVKPSPFYLLDEVDAALDDANIERFSQMVRDLAAGESQMLIVTHNKKTMELADRMYGVTMGEAGISSIVSAELTQEEPELALA